MPVHMRLRKLRGPHMKKSMPFEQFRTYTQPVNLGQLDRLFSDGETVTPDRLHELGLCRRQRVPIKILASGELSKKLDIEAHAFSAAARSKIEAAGGTCSLLGS
jgi:large subunit ribosomal protein L15